MSHQSEYPDLAEMLGTYFHQDWKHESGSAEAALAAAIADASMESRRSALSEVTDLLERPTNPQELDKLLWSGIGCEYMPTGDGWTSTRAWLLHVRDRISESIDRAD